ncbi:MAG: hypothetical protein LBU94_00335 [Clostridiales bacterium]|jgi:integrase|nr:hypothetical protein [Clostridiales bacterium]
MNNILTLYKQEKQRNEYRHSLYSHKLTANNGEVYERNFIVIKNQFGLIVRFTRLHNYVGVYDGKVFSPLTSDAAAKLRYVCMMLNYTLIQHYDKFNIDHIFSINKEMLDCFFRDYAQEILVNGEHRSPQSVEKCVNAVTMFFRKLRRKFGGHMVLLESDFIIEKTVLDKRGRLRQTKAPAFRVKGFPKKNVIFRELPTKAFKILLNLAFRYAPDIAFAMCLQAFAGLRAGEAMNVRQEGSPLGNGLIPTYLEGEIQKIEIDLTKELPLRGDGITCGKIKRERKQCVYPPFIKAFYAAYEYHKSFLAGRSFEADYCPMFINNKGLAMTYKDYNRRFSLLVENHFRPSLLKSSDAECRIYGQLLYENKLGLHVLRHWFSVQLVLNGEDIAQIQYWRGDKSPESALLYLQNKGDLIKELDDAGGTLLEMLMDSGKRAMEQYDGL